MSPGSQHIPRWLLAAALSVVAGGVTVDVVAAQSAAGPSAETADFEHRLRGRLLQNPDDASAWRMLGHVWLEEGETERAAAALEQAIFLDSISVAARFDLGRARQQLGELEAAAALYQEVADLAPESEYGQQAAALLEEIAPELSVTPVDYRIRRFDAFRDEPAEERIEQAESERLWGYSLSVDTGLLYDSNVALSPTSRGLVPGTRESFQLLLAPEAEFALRQGRGWQTGPTLAGNFTLNEGNFRNFNLQSYRGGWFIEGDRWDPTGTYLPRVDYQFTLDEFAGNTFARRNALTPSLIRYWSDDEASTFYWALDYTDFAADGALPSVTSRDGWSNTLGVTHDLALPYRYLRLVRGGFLVERADTVGSDARYNGVALSAQAIFPLYERTEATLRGGWGYRDYPDFISGVPRDENILSAGAELRYYASEFLSAALILSWDRFDSRNVLFEADRLVAGMILTFEK